MNSQVDEDTGLPSKYLDLLKYTTPSPDTHKGTSSCGSCHCMSSTGAMEIINNKVNGITKFDPLGDFDLSERWMMNMVTDMLKDKENFNWISDKVLVYNQFGRTLLQKDYPFTKGKFKGRFNTSYNWVRDLPEDWEKIGVTVPKIKRKVLFGSCKDEDIYKIGVLDESHINMIKKALVKYQGPVQVIYGIGFDGFHSVLIVGYDDDDTSIGRCPFTEKRLKAHEIKKERHKELVASVEKQGWRESGVFYVRDSSYHSGSEGFTGNMDVMYEYGGLNRKHWQPYVAPYVKRSYDWLLHSGNHAVVIYSDPDL